MADKIELKVGQVWEVKPGKGRRITRLYPFEIEWTPSFGMLRTHFCLRDTFRAWVRRHNARVQP